MNLQGGEDVLDDLFATEDASVPAPAGFGDLLGGDSGAASAEAVVSEAQAAVQAPSPSGQGAGGEEGSPAPGSPQLQFTAKKFVLQGLLEKASSVVPSKDIMPLLKNFQFDVKAGHFQVVATDLELSVVSQTEMVMTQVPGVAVFPAKKMLEIIREADEGDVVVAVQDNLAHIEVGRTSWDLKLQQGDDYPDMPDSKDVQLHSVDRVKFLSGIQSVRYAAARDTTRPSLMMIDVSKGRMTACDGVRFQQSDLGEDFPLESLQIPTGAIDDLVKLLRSTDMTSIGIGESESHLVFGIGTDLFLANKLMAQFPDVEALLLRPALANKLQLSVDRQDLVDAVKRVRINADSETSAIGLVLDKGKMVVTSKDKFGNGAEETIEAGWAGSRRMLVVNHQFLLDMLGMYDGKSCSFFLGEDTKSRKSPLLLRDDTTRTTGVVQQMVSHLVGYTD
jgi:DNA polymerase-3 subunit beta